MGKIVASSFTASAREKAQYRESVIKEGHLYVGWSQIISSDEEDPNSGKYGVCYDINLATSEKELANLTRGKLSSTHANTAEDGKCPLVIGFKETVYNGVTKVVAEKGSFSSDFAEGCAARILPRFTGETHSKRVIQDDGKGEGNLYIVEPFAFVAVRRETYWRSKPVKMNIPGKTEYQRLAVPDPSLGDGLYKIHLHPERGFVFEAPDTPIEEIIKEFKLTIPKEYADVALKDSVWKLEK